MEELFSWCIYVELFYAPAIFKGHGFGNDAAMLQTVIMDFINIELTLVAIFTVDKFGRKPLLIIVSVGMSMGMFAIGILAYTNIYRREHTSLYSYLLGFVYDVVGANLLGTISEIFPNTIRGKTVNIAVVAQWISNFIV